MQHEANVAATDAAHMDATATPFPAAGIRVPGQREARAAWLSLPIETRDRIGTLAVDHMLQMFVAYDLCDLEAFEAHLEDQSAGAVACGDALVRADETLAELRVVIEGASPELFGTDTAGPAWAIPPGPAV